MALTRAQIIDLYVKSVAQAVLSSRILQLYNLLTAGQKNTVWPVIKSDLLADLNTDKTSVESTQTAVNNEYNTTITDLTSKITDVTASVP